MRCDGLRLRQRLALPEEDEAALAEEPAKLGALRRILAATPGILEDTLGKPPAQFICREVALRLLQFLQESTSEDGVTASAFIQITAF